MGYFLAFLTAIFEASRVAITKHSLKSVDEYFLAWAMRGLALILLLPLLFIYPTPQFGEKFWLAVVLIALLNTTSTVVYLKAIKLSQISLTAPILAFSPVFLLLTTPFILGERPNAAGLIGVILIVLGTYLLNLQKKHLSLLAPIKALLVDPGVRLMLVVAFIWSLEANVHKIGIANSSVPFWTVVQFIGPCTLLTVLMLRQSTRVKPVVSGKAWQILLVIGLLTGLGQLAQTQSLALILAVYSIAIKRLSILLTIVFGWLFFKETDIKKRFLAASVMIVGVILISFLG